MNLETYVKETCKPGQGAACCSYLVMGPDGWECAKVQPELKAHLDARRAAETITAQGDNCAVVNLRATFHEAADGA